MIRFQCILKLLTIGAVFALVAGICAAFGAEAQTATPGGEWNPSWPLADEFVATFEGEVPDDLPAYSLDIELDANRNALLGELEVDFTNHTGRPVSEVPFRLYPNAEYYGEGRLAVSDLTVDGAPRVPELSVGDTVLTAPLARLLPVEQTTTIEMRFETIVPTDSTGSFGIFSHDAERDTWILADWYPIIAGWDSDNGWGLDPPTSWGDPTFAEASTYDLRLSVPPGMSVASSGATDSVSNGPASDDFLISSGPVREFALVLDNRFAVHERVAGDTLVRLHLDGAAASQGAARVLGFAVSALDAYAARYGPYPYDELDIAQTELASALGVSWSGIIFMNAAGMSVALEQSDLLIDQFLFTLIHEIGHQWWGNMVGVNSNDHAFMNESLTNYLSVVVFEDIYGTEAGLALLERSLAEPYLAQLAARGDGVVDLPIEDVTSITAYARLIYGKGSLGFLAIRLEIGDAAFFTALRRYAQVHAFGLAAPEDLRSAFEQASGGSLDDIWRFWFDASQTTAADVEALLSAASMS